KPFYRLSKYTQNCVIHLPLPAGEAPIHRDRPGHVRIIVGIAGRDIQKEQFTLSTGRSIVDVMEHAGITARGDDRQIRKMAPIADELVSEFGFDFRFGDAGPEEAKRAMKAFFGERHCLTDQFELSFRLEDSEPVHERS